MSTAQEFNVEVNGKDYNVTTSTQGSRDHFVITAHNGAIRVTDQSGECNPLRTLWGSWKYQTTHGAARTSMELKCIREAVEYEVQAHINFCFEQIDEEQ